MNSKSTPPFATPPVGASNTGNISSQKLFRGHQEICIEHADQVYRLRITRQGKLILTK